MLIYKIFTTPEWAKFESQGLYAGSVDDQRDGFIHFSTFDQVSGTLAKHYTTVPGVVIAAVDAQRIAPSLRWEVSRGGDKFPHLYASLEITDVIEHWTLIRSRSGFDLAALTIAS